MPEISLRPLRSDDVDAVVRIWNAALHRDPITVGRFCGWLFGDADYRPGADSGMIVAERAGRLIGFIRAIVRRSPNDRVGLEPELGWIPVVAVDPAEQRQGAGRALLAAAVDYLRGKGRRQIFVCGNTGSAPGYVFPGVDQDAYAGALALFKRAGFVVDHEPIAMSRETIGFDQAKYDADAWAVGGDIVVEGLTPARVQDFLVFLAESFPGDWNIAARAKIRAGGLDEMLIARRGETVLGYCQWEGEHFGPFGVSAAERGGRIGAKLFAEAVRRIRAADGRSVWFNWADDDAARFYRRFGLDATRRFAILRKDL
ncbi:MAG TPA: GNAT family N-acetyltransferase [Phycisphaerae bacterium]|nr:GNAT family N-acetyltransferase [Phycisphaerae bacterium]